MIVDPVQQQLPREIKLITQGTSVANRFNKPAVIDEASSPVAFLPVASVLAFVVQKWRLAVTGVIPGELLRGWAVAKICGFCIRTQI